MALPRFTTNPTPLYQQQPIIKRQNYGDLYMRNFAAAEATTYKTFASIGAALEKKREKREKKLDKQKEYNARKFELETGGLDKVTPTIELIEKYDVKDIDNDGVPIENKMVLQLKDDAKLLAALPLLIKYGEINPSTGEPWTNFEAEGIRSVYNANISVIKPSMEALSDLSKNGEAKLEGKTNALKEGDNWQASLYHEIHEKASYDLKVGMNGPNKSIKWTDDYNKDDDGKFIEYEKTLKEIKEMKGKWFDDREEAFDFKNEDLNAENTKLNRQRNESGGDWGVMSGTVPVDTRISWVWIDNERVKSTVTTEERDKGRYNSMSSLHRKDWIEKNGMDFYNNWRRFQDDYVTGKPQDEYKELAMNIISHYPEKYSSTKDSNGDGVPDHAEDLINIIGSYNTWDDNWKSKETKGELMHMDVWDEMNRVLSKRDFENYYRTQGKGEGKSFESYASMDKNQIIKNLNVEDKAEVTKHRNNIHKIDYLTKALDSIDAGLDVDPNIETEEPYTSMFMVLSHNYDNAAKLLGKGNKVTWRIKGIDPSDEPITDDEEAPTPRTIISIGTHQIDMKDTPAGKDKAKRKIFQTIIEEEPVFGWDVNKEVTRGYKVEKLWQGYKASKKSKFFQTETDKKNAKKYADWLEKCRQQAGKNRGYNTTIN